MTQLHRPAPGAPPETAALAIQQGVSPRKVDYQTLQKKPTAQGAALPGVVPAKAK